MDCRCRNAIFQINFFMWEKLRITPKKASNESFSELNFIQKVCEHIRLSPLWSGASGFERLTCSKYYDVWKCQITFNLGLNVAKNTHHIKKLLIKVIWNWILYKEVCERICLSLLPLLKWSLGARKINMVEILYCTETTNYIYFWVEQCQKYAPHEKSFKYKLFRLEHHTKKSVSAYVYLPLEWS